MCQMKLERLEDNVGDDEDRIMNNTIAAERFSPGSHEEDY
jgi:hypothetical protein